MNLTTKKDIIEHKEHTAKEMRELTKELKALHKIIGLKMAQIVEIRLLIFTFIEKNRLWRKTK